MGTVFHDAIVVTSSFRDDIDKARSEAISLDLVCTEAVPYAINTGWSFLIAPDGSKLGWDVREQHEISRAAWIEWAEKQYALGVYFDWVHVQFGSEREAQASVIADNHDAARKAGDY